MIEKLMTALLAFVVLPFANSSVSSDDVQKEGDREGKVRTEFSKCCPCDKTKK